MEQKNTVTREVSPTEKEREWVKRLADGATYKELSIENDLSKNALAYKLTALREKFGCKNSGELIAVFLRNGLIK